MKRRELLKASLVLPFVGVLKAETRAGTRKATAEEVELYDKLAWADTIPSSLFSKTDNGLVIGPKDRQLEAVCLLPSGVDYIYYIPTKEMGHLTKITADWVLIHESIDDYCTLKALWPSSAKRNNIWQSRFRGWTFGIDLK